MTARFGDRDRHPTVLDLCRYYSTSVLPARPRSPKDKAAAESSVQVLTRWLTQLAKTDVVILDDWATGSIDAATRADLLEIIDARASVRATIITHPLPIEHWHGWSGDATVADAMLDRLLQRCRRIELQGESRRIQEGAKSGGARSTKPAKKEVTA